MSTHDIFRAKEIADKIGIMKKGQLVTEKTRTDFENEDLEKLYMQFMAGYMDQVA